MTNGGAVIFCDTVGRSLDNDSPNHRWDPTAKLRGVYAAPRDRLVYILRENHVSTDINEEVLNANFYVFDRDNIPYYASKSPNS
jgi:hypothetical protein